MLSVNEKSDKGKATHVILNAVKNLSRINNHSLRFFAFAQNDTELRPVRQLSSSNAVSGITIC